MAESKSKKCTGNRSPDQVKEELLQRLIEVVEVVAHLSAPPWMKSEFARALQNDKFRTGPEPWVVTSMPLDPTAKDWAERLNRFTPRTLPRDRIQALRRQKLLPCKRNLGNSTVRVKGSKAPGNNSGALPFIPG